MADVCFQKPEVVISQPRIEISHQNLMCKYLSKRMPSLNPNPEVDLGLRVRHIEKSI